MFAIVLYQIIGSGESCLQTAYHVACIMQETSIKGEVRKQRISVY